MSMIRIINKKLQEIVDGVKQEANFILDVTIRLRSLLMCECNLLKLDGEFYVFGDIHGQFYDLMNMMQNVIDFDTFTIKNKNAKIVFLGDIVDRGYNSVEVFLFIALLKIKYPERVFVLRGNHESKTQTNVYGFKTEIEHKYNTMLYWKICEIFNYFPTAAIINNKYFLVHGGIQPDLKVEEINEANRLFEDYTFFNLLWGDPSEKVDFFELNDRGAGYVYGCGAVDEFLHKNKLEYLVRSHQLVKEGYKEFFDKKCISIWSAPNYMYSGKNKGCIMHIDYNKHIYVCFDAVEDQYRI